MTQINPPPVGVRTAPKTSFDPDLTQTGEFLEYLNTLKAYIKQHPPNCGDADSVLGILYECHNENSPYDNEQIRADFNELYQQMNGMPLREIDKIIYPVCKLCRDHEKAGFVEGIKIGIQLSSELTE